MSRYFALPAYEVRSLLELPLLTSASGCWQPDVTGLVSLLAAGRSGGVGPTPSWIHGSKSLVCQCPRWARGGSNGPWAFPQVLGGWLRHDEACFGTQAALPLQPCWLLVGSCWPPGSAQVPTVLSAVALLLPCFPWGPWLGNCFEPVGWARAALHLGPLANHRPKHRWVGMAAVLGPACQGTALRRPACLAV